MPSINHELLISAPIETVRNAIQALEGLSAWWTTAKMSGENIRFHFGDYFKEIEILKLEALYIEWKCIAGANEWISTTISFSFDAGYKEDLENYHPEIAGQMEQQKGETVTFLSFSHDNWRDKTPMLAECTYTWAMFLRSLKSYCESGKGKPWPNQHQ